MEIEEINNDRDKFLVAVSNNVEIELKKIGLRLINVNVTAVSYTHLDVYKRQTLTVAFLRYGEANMMSVSFCVLATML